MRNEGFLEIPDFLRRVKDIQPILSGFDKARLMASVLKDFVALEDHKEKKGEAAYYRAMKPQILKNTRQSLDIYEG